MTKKGILLLTLLVFITGMAFAQARNTITVDTGPLIVGASFGAAGDLIDDDGTGTSGFGIGLQYERDLNSMLSLAGRFAYLGLGGGMSADGENLDMDIRSWSAEANVRFYPFARSFFLNGMLGYANLATDFSGSALDNSFSASRSYVKLGVKLGWRFVFGSQGGFVFEPSFGYAHGIGLGDSFGSRIDDHLTVDAEEFVDFFNILEQLIFIGGPRISLAFGWKF